MRGKHSTSKSIDFSHNLNCLGGIQLLNAMSLELIKQELSHYPEPYSDACVGKMAAWLDIPKNSIALAPGATSIILSLQDIFPSKNGMQISPTFWAYNMGRAVRNLPTDQLVLSPDNNFALDPNDIITTARRCGSIYICNPNNPTGQLVAKASIEQIARKRTDCTLIIDETYLLFSPQFEKQTMVQFASSSKKLIVVASLSKIFGLPGLRAGIMIAHPEMIAHFKERALPFTVTSTTQMIVSRLFADGKIFKLTQQSMPKIRQRFQKALEEAVGIHGIVYPSEANFFLVKIHNGLLATRVWRFLSRRFIIRLGEDFPGFDKNYIRIAVRNNSDNKIFADEFKTALKVELAKIAKL